MRVSFRHTPGLAWVTSLVLASALNGISNAQQPGANASNVPSLGAQIWIEPGQTPAQIDAWFHTLAVAHLPVARIFLMWSDVETAPGVWDFTLYDAAFRAAEREHVRIVATLTPSGSPPFLGGDGTQGRGVVGSETARAEAARYLRTVVARYRNSPALDTWLLLNEPGQGAQPEPLALQGLPAWLERRYGTLTALNHAWGRSYKSFSDARPPASESAWNLIPNMDWNEYWRTYQTAGLQWLADQVRSADPTHPLHVNPHSLIANLADNNDDLPAWSAFLDSLGCSIHPSWHFGLLNGERYTLGVSYINDLVSGASQGKPYWVTELQGGNNLSSGVVPLNPTADETTQWLWSSIGAGTKRVLFWLLNARSRGVESGEWSLLDFEGRPTERLAAASAVAHTLEANASFFAGSKALRPPVSLIVSLETMTLESHEARADDPARGKNAQVLETFGFYQALSRLGVPPALEHFDAYAWDNPASGRVAVLPDVRALSERQIERLQHFVQSGNTLILTGLSGFYDTSAGAWPVLRPGATQPLAALTGASLKEVSVVEGGTSLHLDGSEADVPADLWRGTLTLVPGSGARAIGHHGAEITATERRLPGGGRVLWLPQTIGTGAWRQNDAPLADLLERQFAETLDQQPFRLKGMPTGCVLRVLSNGTRTVTITANELSQENVCQLLAPAGLRSEPLAGVAGDHMAPHGTSVSLWSPAH